MAPGVTVSFLLVLALVLVGFGTAYLWLLVAGALRRCPEPPHANAETKFAILVPAHNEAATIGPSVRTMLAMDYPEGGFSVHVVADHCSDSTAEEARKAGAKVYERTEGLRGGGLHPEQSSVHARDRHHR